MHTSNRNPRFSVTAVAALAALLAPAAALAHPGHEAGGFWSGLAHPIGGLDHLAAAIAIGVWSARLGARATWAIPCAFLVAMAAGAGLAAAGVGLPLPEPMIAASVLLAGAVIALDARLGLPAAMAAVAAFAPFHAAAHVAEMPAASQLAGYCAGLLAATAVLHAAGVAIACGLRQRPALLRLAAAPVAAAGMALLLARIA